MGPVGGGVFAIMPMAICGYKVHEKYAMRWLAIAAMITLAACLPAAMNVARKGVGMQWPRELERRMSVNPATPKEESR